VPDYLVTSWHDDQAGVLRTYLMGQSRSVLSHVVGSTSVFMNIVNPIVAGTLGALIAGAAGAGSALVAVVGSLSGLGYLALMSEIARPSFRRSPVETRFPGPSAT